MEKLSSTENNNGGRRNDEFQETVEIVTLQEFSRLLESRAKELRSGSSRRRQIQKLPPQFRLRRQQGEHVYDPMMVSLGPYHHGKPELRPAEQFKYLCLDWCARGDEKKKAVFYNKITEKIEVIRDCYAEVTTEKIEVIRDCYAEVTIVEKYDDKTLALMILLDACIIINFIHNSIYMNGNNYSDWQNYLGAGSSFFMFRDMMVLENQIPFQILKLLISLQYEKEEAEGFLERFLSHVKMKGNNLVKIPRESEEPPIHFLEACWRLIANNEVSQPNRRVHKQLISCAHRSVMDLKAKGIHIRPSSSQSIRDIIFTSHAFHGQLELPAYPISDISPIIYSNLIAYEVSPNSNISLVVLSYVVFMKSLIQSADDVKELQETGILYNKFANLDRVVNLFREIDTFGLHDQDILLDIKQKIEEHCNRKAKTWIADLIHTRFQTPWIAIALFAAFFLLCLAFLQTLFTIHPVKMK